MKNAATIAFGLVLTAALGLGGFKTFSSKPAHAAAPHVALATDQEAMSVAWLQDRSTQVGRVIASVTSDQAEQAKIFEAFRFVKQLDQASERLLSDVRARTGLVAPVWSASSAIAQGSPVWLEGAAPISSAR